VDDLLAAQTAQIWSLIGVSDATLMARAGFDADEEAKNKAVEDQKKLEQQQQQMAAQGIQPGQPPFGGNQQQGGQN